MMSQKQKIKTSSTLSKLLTKIPLLSIHSLQ